MYIYIICNHENNENNVNELPQNHCDDNREDTLFS